MTADSGFNEDFLDMLGALLHAEVDFIVVGAHAMAVHGVPRATGDMDVLVRPVPENAGRVLRALERFGAPVESHGLVREDLENPGNVYQIGMPPRRIDLMTSISGLDFDEARASQVIVEVAGLEIPFLGLDALRRNKQATARDKDLVDLRLLEESSEHG